MSNDWKCPRRRSAFAAGAVSFLVTAAANTFATPARIGGPVRICQADIAFNGVETPDSAWGIAELTYEGTRETRYFNLSVAGDWQIRNIPLLIPSGEGAVHTLLLPFDLGVEHGVDVPFIDFGYSLTAEPLSTAPAVDRFEEVQGLLYEINSGVGFEPLVLGSPAPQEGGASGREGATLDEVINQDCNKDECAPAAVSNALKTLKRDFDLRIDDDLITIAAFKEALGWRPPQGDRPGGTGYDWPELKATYLEENRIPVTSEQVDPGQNLQEARKAMNIIIRALERGCMVEITVDGHTALLTSVAAVEGRADYNMTIAHDISQNREGGTQSQNIVYNAGGQKITGGWLMDGRNVRHFAIQCSKRKRRE